MAAKLRERLSASKPETHMSDMEILNSKKPNDVEVIEQYQVEIWKRFAALENLNDGGNISCALGK
jgi:hypothetical protein